MQVHYIRIKNKVFLYSVSSCTRAPHPRGHISNDLPSRPRQTKNHSLTSHILPYNRPLLIRTLISQCLRAVQTPQRREKKNSNTINYYIVSVCIFVFNNDTHAFGSVSYHMCRLRFIAVNFTTYTEDNRSE